MSDFIHEITIFHEISVRAGMVKELCQDMGTGKKLPNDIRVL